MAVDAANGMQEKRRRELKLSFFGERPYRYIVTERKNLANHKLSEWCDFTTVKRKRTDYGAGATRPRTESGSVIDTVIDIFLRPLAAYNTRCCDRMYSTRRSEPLRKLGLVSLTFNQAH